MTLCKEFICLERMKKVNRFNYELGVQTIPWGVNAKYVLMFFCLKNIRSSVRRFFTFVRNDWETVDSRDGVLYIQSPKAQNIGLYGSDGRLVRILRLTEGSNTVTGLSKGVYVIGKKKVGV